MQIGVLADTHLHSWPVALLAQVKELFAQAELILHAGDIINMSVLEELPGPVAAVAGNSDGPWVRSALPLSRIVEAKGFRIGLIHGYGPPGETPARARSYFADSRVDAVVFGHSHMAMAETVGGVLMFNPGSLSSPRDGISSLGRLYLDKGIKAEIIRL
ncbi:MAG: metallophosphoesterase [Desulfarculales bacterium]|jgi:putative phosphoesterase|nr:metallophosphoesterase [Desulfarculales bacterium]